MDDWRPQFRSHERTIKFFRKIAKEGAQIDAVKAVREEREERTKKLSKYL